MREMDLDTDTDTDTDESGRQLRELNYDFGQGKDGKLNISFQLLLPHMNQDQEQNHEQDKMSKIKISKISKSGAESE